MNVRTKNKNQCRDEQLAAGDTEKRAGRADTQAEGDTGDDLSTEFGRHESGQAGRQKPLADQQQTNGHQQDGNRAFKPVIGDAGQ